MVDFKVVVNDPKDGMSYSVNVTGHHANSLIGKKIGEEVDGIFVNLPGYKLQVTGGSDKDGFTMRPDVEGISRKRLLISESIGLHPKDGGVRVRKSVRGNTVTLGIVQVNMKVVKHGSKSVAEHLSSEQSE